MGKKMKSKLNKIKKLLDKDIASKLSSKTNKNKVLTVNFDTIKYSPTELCTYLNDTLQGEIIN